jgi:hypothetical protein
MKFPPKHFYTYKITFVDDDYYYGSRAAIVPPEEDNDYVGSPKTHKEKWKTHTFSKTILNRFQTDKEMIEEENNLIRPVYRTDPHCLNENCAGRINMTPEVRRKISAARIGKKRKPFSEEHKRKISEAKKDRTLSDEHKRKLREARKGRTHSEETKKKLSEAQKGKPGKPISEETRRKMSEAKKGNQNRKGKVLTDETKRKLREAAKGRQRTEETKQKISEAQKGKKRGPYKVRKPKQELAVALDKEP